MSKLVPIQSLYQTKHGRRLNLPRALAELYGTLYMPQPSERAYIISNFVSTLDGVVALNEPGHGGGAEISGFSAQDRLVMAVLRTLADAVIVGAGTVRAEPEHLWTADYILPELAPRSQQRRKSPPLNVIVSGSGKLDLTWRVFQTPEVPSLIVTTAEGAKRIERQRLPPSVHLRSVQQTGALSAEKILRAAHVLRPRGVYLVEGGPQLMATFLAERCVNELFLTFAPQVAGRDDEHDRPGFAIGEVFLPQAPIWGRLLDVRRGENHLFLRYLFS